MPRRAILTWRGTSHGLPGHDGATRDARTSFTRQLSFTPALDDAFCGCASAVHRDDDYHRHRRVARADSVDAGSQYGHGDALRTAQRDCDVRLCGGSQCCSARLQNSWCAQCEDWLQHARRASRPCPKWSATLPGRAKTSRGTHAPVRGSSHCASSCAAHNLRPLFKGFAVTAVSRLSCRRARSGYATRLKFRWP